MRLLDANDDLVTLELTRDELLVTAGALNEILHGPEAIEEWEFQTRTGFEREEAKHVHQALLDAIRD